ncbi:MAG: HAMP domain-containing protein [Elusimicrobia bacterium]|nr:HAMP domain-containing protein [Elusimicrobiota bacterium]
MRKKIYFGLSVKFIVIISSIIIFTSIILTWFFVTAQSLLLKNFTENRAIILANSLARSCEHGVLISNRELLSSITKNNLKEEDVIYAIIYDDNGILLSKENISNEDINRFLSSVSVDTKSIKDLGISKLQKNVNVLPNIGEVLDVIVPIVTKDYSPTIRATGLNQESVIGAARVGITLERINYQIERMTKSIILITLIVVLAGIVMSFFLVKIIVHPIRELMLGTKKIAVGNLSYRVPLNSNDEFRELATSFNSMASDMEIHIRELNKEKKELLNLKIAFEQRSQELEETLEKVQNIQRDLIKSEKFATIGRLASSVAHELRNPLAAIKNISYFLSKMGAYSDHKSKQMVNMLSSEVLRANKIITDLLDYSRTKKLNKLSVDIVAFINKVIPAVPLPTNIALLTDLEDFDVIMDPDKITQVLINLITNARDAMPPEGGEIKITTRKDDNMCQIYIKDNACGMTEETLSHLFEPLFTTKLKGIGLGLPIVKEIIDAHQGKITVTSTKNVGTTFKIELPLQ